MKRHPIRPSYDPYNCNSGIPHIPDTHWDPHSKAWEFNDVQVNHDFIPASLPPEVKNALKNNICLVCGEKNCPYLKEKDFQELIKAINSGDKTGALRVYNQRFAQFRNMKKSIIIASLDRARVARERQGPCGYSGPIQSTGIIAMPGIWSAWNNLLASTGSNTNSYAYTINFNTSSNLESSFDVQIKYPVADGIKTIDTVGPGSYFIEATGAGFSSIRIKSHSVPITVRIEYPKE
ncbi:colicin Z family toxin [Providencia manganoxydans]|uniref:colicin Z family toxin n=2 Tax=Morganellaceae TaxID=1903414 RepID=UPI0024B16BE0